MVEFYEFRVLSFEFWVKKRDGNFATDANRHAVLRDLIAFRQIGVEIIFSIKIRPLIDAAAQSQTQTHRKLNLLPIRTRQSTRMRERNDRRMRVRFRAKLNSIGAKCLRCRCQLNVNFETDDGFVSRFILRG